MHLHDTIAAISSATGAAARILVRASGPQALAILDQLGPAHSLAAQFTALHIRRMKIPAWVYVFVHPHSYTGDDLFELHLPGSPLLSQLTLEEIIRLGARPAEPGEFTARAYFNGRIDLSQAEGVAAVVAAGNEAELSAARRLAAGELTHRLRPMMDQLADALALVEAEIDFSDQGTKFANLAELQDRLRSFQAELQNLLRNSARMARLSHEPRIVLAGRPNAGKSTLLNALAGTARAVVSPTAGTTRDALSARIALRRGMVHIVDIAGLESESAQSSDAIESHMRRRAMAELERADAVILVRDVTDARPALKLDRPADLVVWSKIDLGEKSEPGIGVSAMRGSGMECLRGAFDEIAFGKTSAGEELALANRHVQAISQAAQSIERTRSESAPELLAAELRNALDLLGQICGDVTPDDVLGKIFASFCIGK